MKSQSTVQVSTVSQLYSAVATAVCLCVCTVPQGAFSGEPRGEKSRAHTAAAVEEAIAYTSFDSHVLGDLRELSAAEKEKLLGGFSKATSSRVRQRALEVLVALEPEQAGEAVRGFADDEMPEVSTLALAYLYLKLDDGKAKARLLRSLTAAEQVTAIAAGKSLTWFPGEGEANELLGKSLLSETYPLAVRCEVIIAVGDRGNRPALPALFQLLGDPTPLKWTPDGTMRLCDLAAQSIARVYRAHRVPMDAYCGAKLDVRDQAIAKWQAWAAKQADVTKADPRAEVAADAARDALDAFSTDAGDPEAGRAGMRLAVSGNMCLGVLPGIDQVILPSVRDVMRVLSVLGPSQRNSEVRHWDTLDLRLRREFLPQHPGLSKSAKDAQAVAFIGFLVENPRETGHRFPLDWTWSFCRNFPDVFPASGHRQAVKGYSDLILKKVQEQGQTIIMHGTLPELEPIPEPEAPPKPGRMVQIGLGAAFRGFKSRPSEWRHHRDAVTNLAKWAAERRAKGERIAPDSFFEKHTIQTYPANEIPLLGEAALHLRAYLNPVTALDYANKARILNAENPKVHAILGMIYLQFDPPQAEQAFLAFQEASDRAPESLGGEPESQQAVTFFLAELKRREGSETYAAALARLKKALARP